jgi:hypothetical protein
MRIEILVLTSFLEIIVQGAGTVAASAYHWKKIPHTPHLTSPLLWSTIAASA